MKTTLTKYFRFSASYQDRHKITGHNYILGVTTQALSRDEELTLQAKVEEALIKKLDSKDFGLDVDFLKGVEISDQRLLEIFWGILEKTLLPKPLEVLSLQRNEATLVSLFA